MSTRQCAVCGAEFTPKAPNQNYCSQRGQKKAAYRRNKRRGRVSTSAARVAQHAWHVSAPVSNATIMFARTKPANTSEVRWRIELRRRANPERYEMVGRV